MVRCQSALFIILVQAVQCVSEPACPTVESASHAVAHESHSIRVAEPILVLAPPTIPCAWCCRTCTAPAALAWAASHQPGPSRLPKDLVHFAPTLSVPVQHPRF